MPSRFPPDGCQQHTEDVWYHLLLAAIRAGRAAEVDHLLSQEPRRKGDHPHLLALFKAAVKGGQPHIVRALLRHGVVPFGESPLFAAIEEINALEVVLAEGYSVHVTSPTCKTPLQTAITLNPAALPLLLRAGCDVTARDRVQGNTALHTACAQHEEGALLPLIRAGSWLNAPNWRGETPLHSLLRHACCPARDFHVRSRQSLARCLIHVGCHVTASSRHGRGPRGGRPPYKVMQTYQRLLRETRRLVPPLQHLCRLTVRRLCEEAGRRTPGKEGVGGEDCVEMNMVEVIQTLDVSGFLKDYLLYKHHEFDKEALSPCKARTANDVMGDFVGSG